MNKKVLIVFVLVVILRTINIFLFKDDPYFVLSPRNFNGRGLLSMPGWLDFLIPLLVIILLHPKEIKKQLNFNKLIRPLGVAAGVLATPLLIGFFLNNYVQNILISFKFDALTLSRYLLLILTFIAIHFFADNLSVKNKRVRFFILLLFLFAIAYTQDLFGSSSLMHTFLGLINSVGVTTVFLAVALRKRYKDNPLETILSEALIGIFFTFFLYNVLSVSFFTIFLPFIALLTISFVIYSNMKFRTKIIIASLPFIVALFLNFLPPKIVSPELADRLIERKAEHNSYFTEKIGTVTVKYPDRNLRDISLRFAKVIDAANKICNKELGFSPDVKELVIKGIGQGGFHAEFPNRIVGNIISEVYIKNCLDSTFLNNPELKPGFPDPVNAILHEYSHLFGTIPYHKWWPGAEEEGWATYSATRISKLLYDKHKNLWQPSYDYSRQADKITKLNLSGKAVVWSHPNEYGGFNLWYHLGDKFGLVQMYQLRWKNSVRNINGSMYMPSNPEYAYKTVEVFGKENFSTYGNLPVQKFGDIYSEDDYLYLSKTTGIDKTMIINMYSMMKSRNIYPGIPIR